MKRKEIVIHSHLWLNGESTIQQARDILDAIELKKKRVAKTSLTEPLLDLLLLHVRAQQPWLNIPTDVVKKILCYLPAQECWRIARQLNRTCREWVYSIANVYRLTVQTQRGFDYNDYNRIVGYDRVYILNVHFKQYMGPLYFKRTVLHAKICMLREDRLNFIMEQRNVSGGTQILYSSTLTCFEDKRHDLEFLIPTLWEGSHNQLMGPYKAHVNAVFYQLVWLKQKMKHFQT
jgi:hypothetical protein